VESEKTLKKIIHLDMDAFYAAVEVLDNPSLKGKPVIVGGNKQRGVVSSASYEARKCGVHSAQPIALAMRLCPKGMFLPVRMSRYQEVSEQIFEIFRRFTPLVEPLSIDEAFLDVTASTRIFGEPEEIARKIKNLVKQETGLTVSAGIAPLKFVAKIASGMNKPDGLTVVPPDQVQEFLDPLPIDMLWGVGKATEKVFTALGVKTIGDLKHIPIDILIAKLGKNGLHLHQLSQGIDEREVEIEDEVKSIGQEGTFPEDIIDEEIAKREILSLSTSVARRLRKEGVRGKTITLKVKYHDFVQITRSRTIAEPTDDGAEITQVCYLLLRKTDVGRKSIRLLGVSVSQLTSLEAKQLSLFSRDSRLQKSQRLNKALDAIEEKFGEGAILPGTLLKK
jgi:DNA polymerase IV